MDKQLCYTCLSKHRNLVPLSAMKTISSRLKTVLVVDFSSPVCWECQAVLQRMQSFVDQVSTAQELLKCYVGNPKSPTTLQSLSKLSVSVKSDCDANIVYGLKCEAEGTEEIGDFQSGIECDQEEQEIITKIEIDDEFQDKFCQLEFADMPSESCCISADSGDERPLINRSPTTLQTLSKLSVSVKSDCDANIVYGLKCEAEGSEEIGDHQSGIEYDQKEGEIIPKIEGDFEFHDNFLLEEVSGETCRISPDSDDEKPLVKRTTPKKNEAIKCDNKIEKNETKRSKDEKKYTMKKITLDYVYRLREEDRKNTRYMACPFKCETCITGYYSEDRYKSHMELRHSDAIGPHTCDICQQCFKSAASLSHHRDEHFLTYQCRGCNVTSHKLSVMLIHSAKHYLPKFNCEDCGFSCHTWPQLRYHRDKAHMEQPAVCDKCDKRFVTQQVLQNHVRQVHDKQICTQCGRAVSDMRSHLAKHARPAPPSLSAFCVECGKSFKKKQEYERHIRTAHRKEEDVLKFKCNVCPRRFPYHTSLQRHVVAKHTKPYPFTCALCSKGFLSAGWLKYHESTVHKQPLGAVCSYCGRTFKMKKDLIRHIRTHTGDKPYRCEQCPLTFARLYVLKNHTRMLHVNTGGAGKTGGDGNTGGSGKSDNTEVKS